MTAVKGDEGLLEQVGSNMWKWTFFHLFMVGRNGPQDFNERRADR